MKIILRLLFVALSSVAVTGQTPQLDFKEAQQLIQQLLQSPAKKDQAWAARLASRHKLAEFTSTLIAQLPTPEMATQETAWAGEDYWLTKATLDALIQLEAAVETERLMPLFDQFRTEVLILLAQSSALHQHELLALLKKNLTNDEWLAVCNLLAAQRSPGLAASLLRDLHIQVSLHVTDDPHAGYVSGGLSGGVGCGIGQIPAGFPPPVWYTLTAMQQHGSVLVAGGRHPIYYQREEIQPSARGQFGISSRSGSGNRDAYRVEYLLDLINAPPEERELPHNPSFTLVWQSPWAYEQEVRQIRWQLRQTWQSVVRRLLQEELLTAAEAHTLAPQITFSVQDHREDQTWKLPDLPLRN